MLRNMKTQAGGRAILGTQYVGLRARTTGAPQNHWFGPSGDPRGAGIGKRPEANLDTLPWGKGELRRSATPQPALGKRVAILAFAPNACCARQIPLVS